MVADCGANCARWLLCLSNFVFIDFVEPAVIEQAAYILIAIGAFILIISILGYCGALKESRVLLTAYGIFLIIIFLLQIAAILLCTLYKPQADHHTKAFLKETLEKYYTTESQRNAVTLSWDHVMAQGCYDKLQNHISGNLDLAIGTVVGVAAAQLLAIVFAFCLCRAVGQERDYHYKY